MRTITLSRIFLLCRQALLHKFHKICCKCCGSKRPTRFCGWISMCRQPALCGWLNWNSCWKFCQKVFSSMSCISALLRLFNAEMSSIILSMREMFFSTMLVSLVICGCWYSSLSRSKSLAWRMVDSGLRISCAKLDVSTPSAASFSVCASRSRSAWSRINSMSSSVSSCTRGMARTYTCVPCIVILWRQEAVGRIDHVSTTLCKSTIGSLSLSSGMISCACWLNSQALHCRSNTITPSCTRLSTMSFKPLIRSNAVFCFFSRWLTCARYSAEKEVSSGTR